jgi:hypothetical protein
MDMTNFIRQSNNNMNVTYDSTSNHNQNHVSHENMNGTFHKSNGKPSVTFQYNVNDFAKKANSLDSINAVERELDEVLKDLEMNSADLNEQLETEYNHRPNVVELPISIQKTVKVDSSSSSSSNSCSSPSISLNKSNNSGNSVKWSSNINNSHAECTTPTNFDRMKRTDFVNKNCELFIEDSARNGMSSHGNNNSSSTKKSFNQNVHSSGNGRQNIISTYELCNECFDNTMLMSNQHEHHHQGSSSAMHSQPHSKCFKNHGNGNANSKPANNFRDANNHSSCPISPLAYQENGYGHSTDGMSYQSNRPRLAQINESVVPESSSQVSTGKQSSTLRKSNENKSNQHNGNVISQKVISIGMPSRNGCESPSPSKHSEFKSKF